MPEKVGKNAQSQRIGRLTNSANAPNEGRLCPLANRSAERVLPDLQLPMA